MKNSNSSRQIKLASVLLIVASAFTSSYYYHLDVTLNYSSIVFPGLSFTIALVAIFLITKTVSNFKDLLVFSMLMVVTYIGVYCATYFSFAFASVTGPFTCGLGALATFALVNRFVIRIPYKAATIFSLGAIGFLLSAIVLIEPIRKFLGPIYMFSIDLETMYARAILLWQILVGFKVVLSLPELQPEIGNATTK